MRALSRYGLLVAILIGVTTAAMTARAQEPPETHEVEVDNDYFEPQVLTIQVGDTVMWHWEANGHTVTSGAACTSDGRFDAGLRNDGATFEHTFTTAGTFPYHCIAHCGQGMTGAIIVE